jgi:hypothetical protein
LTPVQPQPQLPTPSPQPATKRFNPAVDPIRDGSWWCIVEGARPFFGPEGWANNTQFRFTSYSDGKLGATLEQGGIGGLSYRLDKCVRSGDRVEITVVETTCNCWCDWELKVVSPTKMVGFAHYRSEDKRWSCVVEHHGD